jgi:histidine triad (HIT) family protein
MDDSIFTKIINGEVSCNKVFENDKVIAFLDIHPASEGHVLVVPKQQIDHLDDLGEELYQEVMRVVKIIATKIKKELKPDRVGLVVEGYGVPHAHVHVFPTYGKNNPVILPNTHSQPDFKKLTEMAIKLSI